jgi:hypothetical protein
MRKCDSARERDKSSLAVKAVDIAGEGVENVDNEK